MLLPYTVSLFGHRQIENAIAVEAALRLVIDGILSEHDCVEFLVGSEGEFDVLSASVIKEALRRSDTGGHTMTLVLPYVRAGFEKNREAYEAYYDNVELCEESASAHPKAAIRVRNRSMVDRSDLCVFYVFGSPAERTGQWSMLVLSVITLFLLASCRNNGNVVCYKELIALCERDAYLAGFKLGMRMMIEILTKQK